MVSGMPATSVAGPCNLARKAWIRLARIAKDDAMRSFDTSGRRSQYTCKRLGQVAAPQRLAQHLLCSDGSRPLRELRATVAAHQGDRQGGPNPPAFGRQLGADQIRHGFIGEYEIEALRLGLKRLQRRGARFEAHGLIAEPGKHFLGERNQGALVVDNHHGFAVSAWQLADRLNYRSSGFAGHRQPDLELRPFSRPRGYVDGAPKLGDDAV